MLILIIMWGSTSVGILSDHRSEVSLGQDLIYVC